MKKIILVILVILFCIGCEARYNITINEDLTVYESIIGLETDEFYNQYTNSSRERVMNFVIATKEKYLNDNNYIKEIMIEENLSGLKESKKYNTLEEYISTSIAYQQFYEDFKYEEKDNIVTIKLDNKLKENGNDPNRYLIEKGEISITLPFKVVNHNADRIENNTYIWEVNSYNNKKINFSFDKTKIISKKHIPGHLFLIIIIGIVSIISLNGYKLAKKRNEF